LPSPTGPLPSPRTPRFQPPLSATTNITPQAIQSWTCPCNLGHGTQHNPKITKCVSNLTFFSPPPLWTAAPGNQIKLRHTNYCCCLITHGEACSWNLSTSIRIPKHIWQLAMKSYWRIHLSRRAWTTGCRNNPILQYLGIVRDAPGC
jgi:hypothetical protein